MELYGSVVFVHVAAMVGIFAALGIEWVALRLLRRSASSEQGREALALWTLVPRVGGPAVLVALASGVYLARALGAWNLSWVGVAIPTMVLVGIAGTPTARVRKRLANLYAIGTGNPADAATRQLTGRLWTASLRVRTALLVGLVYEMAAKPSEGVLVMMVFAAAGLFWAAVPVATARRAAPSM